MKIKTIRTRLDNAEQFDAQVNEAIGQGWHLSRREVLHGGPLTAHAFEHRMLYAELVMLDPPEELETLDVFDCAEAIRLECSRYGSCQDCPLENVCNCSAPHEWMSQDKEN